MINFYLENELEKIGDESGLTESEAIREIESYFKSNFTKEELLELLIRGQRHAWNDDRTNGYFNK